MTAKHDTLRVGLNAPMFRSSRTIRMHSHKLVLINLSCVLWEIFFPSFAVSHPLTHTLSLTLLLLISLSLLFWRVDFHKSTFDHTQSSETQTLLLSHWIYLPIPFCHTLLYSAKHTLSQVPILARVHSIVTALRKTSDFGPHTFSSSHTEYLNKKLLFQSLDICTLISYQNHHHRIHKYRNNHKIF